MAAQKSPERVFYAVLPDKGSQVKWCEADGRTAYGLPPNAYLDLGGVEPLAWVLVVCRGPQSTIACEQVFYEDFYEAAPAACHPRLFRVGRESAVAAAQPWEQARLAVTRRQQHERYTSWRAEVAECVATRGFFAQQEGTRPQ